MKITYTESADSRLDHFKNMQAKKLEKFIISDKYYPGIESIEITGNDIQKYAKELDFNIKDTKRLQFRFLFLIMYFFVGLTCMFLGIFYSQFKEQILYQPVEAMLIIVGFFFSLLSALMAVYFKYRDNLIKSKHNSGSQVQIQELIKNQDREKSRIDQIYLKLMELEKQAKDLHPEDVQVQINQYHS